MKKTFFLPIFLSFFSLAFSFHLEEYKIFTEAETLSRNGQYEKASFKFKTLEKTLPNSFLVENNYHHFFNSLNFYKMKDLNRAIFQMEKAVYIPEYLDGKNLFSKDRDFYLASFYSELRNRESSDFYFFRALENGFSPLEKHREKIALENLKSNNIKYKVLFEIIFYNDFLNGNLLDENNLIEAAEYLFNSNRTFQAEKLLILGYGKTKKSLLLNRLLLQTLFENKNYSKILEISEEIIAIEPRVSYFYYRGKAFKKLKNYPMAIFNLDKVHLQNFFREQNVYENEASVTLLNILFTLQEYSKIIEVVNRNNSYNSLKKSEQLLVIFSYFKISDSRTALNLSNDFIKNNSSSFEANYLNIFIRNSLDSNKKFSLEATENFMNIPTLNILDILVKEFLAKLSTTEKTPVKLEEIEKIQAIEKLNNSDFLILELENGDFPNFFISDTYAKNNLYNLAFLNSKKNKTTFGNSKNFISYLYPKYQFDLVEDFSKKFGFPPEIFYTVILLSSEFKENDIQLESEKLSKIYKDNQNTPLPTMIEYLYGEEIKESIVFENGDTNIFRITDTILKENILSLIKTYTFYKNIY